MRLKFLSETARLQRKRMEKAEVTKKLIFFTIGIKHDFLCITICWARREVLKPEPRRGFQRLPRGLADVNVSKNRV